MDKKERDPHREAALIKIRDQFTGEQANETPAHTFVAAQIRAAKRGLVLHQLRCKDGATVFMIVRNPMWKEFAGLGDVVEFLSRWECRK
jgi:hypothetical protein